jgi:hypothetical protein
MGQNRNKLQRERDLVELAERYLHGESQCSIAVALHVSPATICRDLRCLQKRWQHQANIDFDKKRAEQLAKIDELERTYWFGWNNSLKREITITEKREGSNDESESRALIRRESRDGNPSFLEGVFRCIERRCKLLGLDAPTKQDVTLYDFSSWTDEEVDRGIVAEAESITGGAAKARGSKGSSTPSA